MGMKVPEKPQGRPGDIDCSRDVPIVKQEFKDDCDVNLIIARCVRNGVPVPTYDQVAPVFADVSAMGEYRDVLERLRLADEAFLSLDVKVRNRFRNDPAELIAFMSDSANYDEAVSLGLLKPKTGAPEPKATEPAPKARDVSKGKAPKELPPSED